MKTQALVCELQGGRKGLGRGAGLTAGTGETPWSQPDSGVQWGRVGDHGAALILGSSGGGGETPWGCPDSGVQAGEECGGGSWTGAGSPFRRTGRVADGILSGSMKASLRESLRVDL